MSWKGWTSVGTAHKKEVDSKEKYLVAVEQYSRDIKRGHKIPPDLAESVMELAPFVKDVSRVISSKMNQFRCELYAYRFCTFGCREE